MKGILWAIFAVVVVFFLWGSILNSSPEEKAKAHARDAISLCKSNQDKVSNTQSERQFIASVCEQMESNYKQEYGTTP
ncbi:MULTISPECIES: hypothetical protein [Tatumella]|uniref:Entry exclusion protein n=1 Tax=Tatumella punctata TaxID=399969 RepID=A0ABW1VVE9_9GAMM|nr:MULTISPECIES: hypothetical protein [unclassified Tatumella]MBS0855992.1 hypothetical protein [Tatumella sp. JGM16]MBS0878604.1 hypothetical protein [Tatumella sp. JGM82]MBS0892180.1 hypothetical protein [Tatumella sp. JGM94]MBS0903310.1 hypothetical protein [Tatumella sp. JGM100]MBS0912971.1 hypothetical protein [Tatumella sp. JGM91]